MKSRSSPSSIRKILFFFCIIWASCPGNMKNWTQDSGSKLNKKQNCLLILKTHFHSLGAVIPSFAQKHTTIPQTLNTPCPIKWHHLNTSYFILSILEPGIDCHYKKSSGVPCDNWPCPQEEITAQRGAELSVPNHQIPAQSGSQVQILHSDWSSELGSSWHECTADCRSQLFLFLGSQRAQPTVTATAAAKNTVTRTPEQRHLFNKKWWSLTHHRFFFTGRNYSLSWACSSLFSAKQLHSNLPITSSVTADLDRKL